MKAQIIIEFKGNFDEHDIQEEVSLYEQNISQYENEKFDKFKVSYNIIK
jgi:hypothetical protein